MTYLANRDYYHEVVAGRVAGATEKIIYGHCYCEDNNAEGYPLYDGVATSLADPSSAETVNIVSDDTEDSPTGTGARTVKIVGLGSSNQEIEETVTMNGTNNVTTVNSFNVVLGAQCITAGSDNMNVGNITIALAGGDEWAVINPGVGVTRGGVYRVPSGRVAYLRAMVGWCLRDGQNTRIKVFLRYREPVADSPWVTIIEGTMDTALDTEYGIALGLDKRFSEGTDIRLTFNSSKRNVDIYTMLHMIEEDA